MKSFVAFFSVLVAVVAAQECGKLQNVNVDDKNANLPWTVQLRERTSNEVVCSGTLISNQHALIGNTKMRKTIFSQAYMAREVTLRVLVMTLTSDLFTLLFAYWRIALITCFPS